MSQPNTNTAVEKRRDLRSMLEAQKTKDELAKVLPKHLTPDRILRVALTAWTKTPGLQECTPESILQGVMICAQAGLEPDGRLAHLIPYGKVAQVIFDYKGLVTLAKRNGVDVKSTLVFSKDDFEYVEDDGSGKTVLRHRFDPFSTDRGNIIGVYSRAIEAGKAPDYEVMSIGEVEAIRSRSKAKNSGPWVSDYGEMVKKTPIRRQSKRWDLLPEIRDVINSDDDTPDFTPARVSAPMFSLPAEGETAKAKGKDNGKKTEQGAPESDRDDGETQGQQPAANDVSALCISLRAGLEDENLSESQLLKYLFSSGTIEWEAKSLEEIGQRHFPVLGMLMTQWDSIIPNIKAAK